MYRVDVANKLHNGFAIKRWILKSNTSIIVFVNTKLKKYNE